MMRSITSDDVLGKTAVDPEGTELGVVTKVHISNDTKQITGITVDTGFMKPDLFIGVDYIRLFGVDAVLLNKIPQDRFIGCKVLTYKGDPLGEVKKIYYTGKRPSGLIVHSKKLKEDIVIKASQVKEFGDFIIMKKSFNTEGFL